MPWHDSKLKGAEKEVPYCPGLPTKRTPIKGMLIFQWLKTFSLFSLITQRNSVEFAHIRCRVLSGYVLKNNASDRIDHYSHFITVFTSLYI